MIIIIFRCCVLSCLLLPSHYVISLSRIDARRSSSYCLILLHTMCKENERSSEKCHFSRKISRSSTTTEKRTALFIRRSIATLRSFSLSLPIALRNIETRPPFIRYLINDKILQILVNADTIVFI